MAAKRIKQALDALATFDGVDGDPMTVYSMPAEEELSALVKMARIIVQHNDTGLGDSAEVEAAWSMLRELTKETP